MSAAQETASYDIPPYVSDFSAYFDLSRNQRETHGGFAEVYSNSLGRQKYAIKILRPYSRTGGAAVMIKDFNFELSSWLKLGSHPNILELTGICYSNLMMPSPQPCFLSVWQDKGQINDYLASNPNSDLVDMLKGVLAGLVHMHERGVIHGDLRGGNILVSRNGVPRITDFGLSKLFGQDSSSSSCSGTLRWMAIEMLDADLTTPDGTLLSSRRSKATDIWAIGMTILELLSGEKPYSNFETDIHVLPAITKGDKPNYPGATHSSWLIYEAMLLEQCNRCWNSDPSKRPSAQKLHTELSDYLQTGSIYGSEDSNSDDSSSTPRAKPLDDTSKLLESVSSLSLSSPEDKSSAAPDIPSHLGAGFDSGNGAAGDHKADISYMTALSNHLMAAKRRRKISTKSSTEGPPHAPNWTVSILIDNTVYGTAIGPNKRIAQEQAAKQAFPIIEKEEIDHDVPYLPVFMNRLHVRGAGWHSQFRWHSVVVGNWTGTQTGKWKSTLYRKGVEIGQGMGNSEDLAKGEAARNAALVL